MSSGTRLAIRWPPSIRAPLADRGRVVAPPRRQEPLGYSVHSHHADRPHEVPIFGVRPWDSLRDDDDAAR